MTKEEREARDRIVPVLDGPPMAVWAIVLENRLVNADPDYDIIVERLERYREGDSERYAAAVIVSAYLALTSCDSRFW